MKTTIPNPHNFVPERFVPRTIAIVGGKGAMGGRLAEEFRRDGYAVLLTGDETSQKTGSVQPRDWKRAVQRWNENVCKEGEVVVFAVPIPLLAGADGLKRIFGRVPQRGWRDKLVIDVCSTKTGPLKTLAQFRGASVIGTHPMFGPKLKSLAGQTVFVCPIVPLDGNRVLQARLRLRLQWLKEFWERRGVQVVELGPAEHDAFVPAVQFGVLLSVLLYAEGLRQSGAALERVQDYGTPNSRALCARLARMISPAILPTYVNLAFENPHNQHWLDSAIASLAQLKDWMGANNREAVLTWMRQLAEFQPPAFRTHFADATIFLDECLAKRDFLAACLAKEADIKKVLASAAAAVAAKGLPQQ